ncbi:DUF3261 domain-containing protein [Rheinheimera muenzenbergensis]|uniref:DUF3261 domain-containing protein n=1 Tax=Rheinheimera muenzenbergensis TaxID=1193628 RepID=A0ABU8C5F7_9GAMM
MSGRRVILAICLLLLSGCQQWRLPPAAGWVALDAGHFQLLDSWPGAPQQLVQQLHWQDGERQQQFLLTVLLQADGYLLVALSPLGHEIWRMQYSRGHQLNVTGMPPFNQPQFARRLLAEMQLALLQPSFLTGRLQQLSLRQQDGVRRLLRSDGSVVLSITQAGLLQPGSQIGLSSTGYQLQITTLQQELL